MIVSLIQPPPKPQFVITRSALALLSVNIYKASGCSLRLIWLITASSEMGFGGFGESGMGSYHGKTGFDTFSHYKSIVDKKTWMDLPMRYQPYNKVFDFLIRLFMH